MSPALESFPCLTDVPLAPTPTLDSLLQRRELELAVAVQQATNSEFPPEQLSARPCYESSLSTSNRPDYALQESSIKLVQSAIESLPTGEQQSMASLMMK